MQPYLGQHFGNPSSAHTLGREMKRALERSREQVANLIGVAELDEIVFTSCGSESDNWAIRGVLATQPHKRHIVTTQVEHEAVRNLCRLLENDGYEVTWLGVDQNGELDLDSLRRALRPETALVSTMLANNETGVLFPIEEIGRIVREESEAVFHVDGVQAVGKIPIDLKNTSSICLRFRAQAARAAGVGALYIRKGISLSPFIVGGGQDRAPRRNSAVPNIVGLGPRAAAHEDNNTRHRNGCAIVWKTRFSKRFQRASQRRADRSKRLPNTSNISFEYVDGKAFSCISIEAGICVSTGSACHSTTHESSQLCAP
jgi:cysteine desulfurase